MKRVFSLRLRVLLLEMHSELFFVIPMGLFLYSVYIVYIPRGNGDKSGDIPLYIGPTKVCVGYKYTRMKYSIKR